MPVRFDPGRVVATPAALAVLENAGQSPLSLLSRHLAGDWGSVCQQDAAANEDALASGARIMSVYTLTEGSTIWIITDAVDDQDCRHCTTLLRPEDY